MPAVNVMRIRETAPEPRKQEGAADDDDEDATADATADVLGLVRGTMRAPGQEPDPAPGGHNAMATLTPPERRKAALRLGYAACLLPG